jgi:tetratricopeptide (TPR) repeat protein
MSSSEIAKLESRWRENPQGLTFAPLAEAYRKMRDIPRALEILAEGLGRHPDYIPASIVLGRCQLDLGSDEQAEAAFHRVLELDDENVIALKALADIAERQGRLEEAGSRLLALLEIDRSNDEARIQLARVEALRESGGVPAATPDVEAEAAPGAPPPAETAASAAATTASAEPDTPGAVAFERELEPSRAGADQLADLEDNLHTDEDVDQLPDLLVDDVPAISSDAAAAPAMPGLVGQDFPEHSAAVTPLEDLAPGNVSLGGENLVGEIESSEEIQLEVAGNSEFQLVSATDDWDTSAERAGGSEYQLPSAADELIAEAAAGAESDLIDPVAAEYGGAIDAHGATPEPPSYDGPGSPDEPGASEELSAPEEPSAPGEPTAAEAPAEAEEEFAAEFEEAVAFEPPVEFAPAAVAVPDLEVEDTGPAGETFEAARGPDPEPEDDEDADADLVVTESMAELFLRQGHRAEALRVYRALYRQNRSNLSLREKVDELETALAAEQSPPRPAAGFMAPDPSRSVSAFLSGLLQARPADLPAGWDAASGAAQRLSDDPAASEEADAAPTMPAADHLSLSAVFGEEGSPVPPASPAAVAGEDGISFDAFFGGEQSGGAPRQRSASREDDDLDQFHAWLQNLKR